MYKYEPIIKKLKTALYSVNLHYIVYILHYYYNIYIYIYIYIYI